MKVYRGIRPDGPEILGTRVMIIEDGEESELPMRLDLFNHSPSGLEWGYGGSGPAQLALALLADAIGDDRYAVRKHQDFKRDRIARLDRDEWQMSQQEVLAWVSSHPLDSE